MASMPFDHDGTPETSDSSVKGSPGGTTLRREVLNPTPHNTGVGVMLVASAAMFFAVASSAFVLRTQQKQCAEPQKSSVQRISVDNSIQGIEVIAIEVIDTDLKDEGIDQCGDPIIRAAGNNSTEILFRVCPK